MARQWVLWFPYYLTGTLEKAFQEPLIHNRRCSHRQKKVPAPQIKSFFPARGPGKGQLKNNHFGVFHPTSAKSQWKNTRLTGFQWGSGFDLPCYYLSYGSRWWRSNSFLPPGVGLSRELTFWLGSLSSIVCPVEAGSAPVHLLSDVSRAGSYLSSYTQGN